MAPAGNGIKQEPFEDQRREIALSMLKKTDEFLGWDLKFNNNISELAAILVDHLKRNPKILESNTNIQDIIAALNAKAEQKPGVSGGDVVGGTVWDDIWKIIQLLLEKEKSFVIEIIKFILGMK